MLQLITRQPQAWECMPSWATHGPAMQALSLPVQDEASQVADHTVLMALRSGPSTSAP